MSDAPIRVLLMEDDAGLARLCRLKLLKAGYTVTVASNGEQGLSLYDAEPCDVVVLDQNMPVYDGLEVLRRLAARGPLKPVVMVTGAGSERIAVEAMKLGARDYVVKDADGWYLDLLPTVIERALQQQRTEESVRLFRTLVDRSSDMILITDPETGCVLDANETACRSLGYSRDEILRLRVCDFDSDVYHGRSVGETAEAMKKARRLTVESRHTRQDGTTYPVEVTLAYVTEPGRDYVVAFCRDITERLETEAAMRRLAAIVESSHDAIVGKTLDGTITSWNAGAERMYGYTAEEALGRPISILVPPDCRDEIPKVLEHLARDEKVEEFETDRLARDGRRIQVSLIVSPIKDVAGRIVGASTIARDITARKVAEEALRAANRRLEELATTDELTGLWNRRHIMKTLAMELERARRQRSALSLVLFDVDRFKTLNDTYGHNFGDTVLATIGETLRAVCRLSDVAGRYGGDEFLVFAPGASEDEARAAAERIRTQAAARVLRHDGQEIRISLSVGVASVAGADAGTPEALIARADKALYAAKDAGRGCVRTCEPLAALQPQESNI